MQQSCVVLLIMIFGGVAGGLANYLIDEAPDKKFPSVKFGCFGYIIIGIVASLSVPLFLSMGESGLIVDAAKPNSFDKKAILLGFCIVAAFSSRAFMTSLSKKILQKVDEAVLEAGQAKANSLDAIDTAKSAQEAADDAIDQAEEVQKQQVPPSGLDHESTISTVKGKALDGLSDRELAALRATGQLSLRTRTGIARDSQIAPKQVSEIIESLAEKGLIERTRSPTTNGLRFKITPDGIATLNKSYGNTQTM